MISGDPIFSSFKTSENFHTNFTTFSWMLLLRLGFLICYAAEFHWTEITQVVSHHCGDKLIDEQVNVMDWSTKVNYVKGNPFNLTRQIDDYSSTYEV